MNGVRVTKRRRVGPTHGTPRESVHGDGGCIDTLDGMGEVLRKRYIVRPRDRDTVEFEAIVVFAVHTSDVVSDNGGPSPDRTSPEDATRNFFFEARPSERLSSVPV